MDIEFLLWLEKMRTPALDALFLAVTKLGEEAVLIALICALYWCVNKRLAQFMIFNFFFGFMLNQLLKITFCVKRPFLRDARLKPVPQALKTATGYSFPSGHTADAVASYGSLAVWFRKKRLVSVLFALLVLLIGFSRMYLGVHTPQDVAVSLAAGALVMALTAWCASVLRRNPAADAPLAAAGVAVCLAAVVYALVKPYPAGTDETLTADVFKTAGASMGMLMGWLFERRKVNFSTRAPLTRQLIKFAGGIAVVALLMALKSLLNAALGLRFGGFTRYALIAFFAMGLWPYLFTRLFGRAENLRG